MDNKISKVKRMKEILEIEIKEKVQMFEKEAEVEVESILIYKDYKKNEKEIKITVRI